MSKYKPSVFRGSATALITPFCGKEVDYAALGRIIEEQIACGTDALVICGTTGETSTLSDDEHKRCIEFAVETADGRVPVIAGTGSNNTAHAAELSRFASEYGADALLIVTPYYNKATSQGLVRHFLAVADAASKPIILYNVPSRTGVNLSIPICAELSRHERIVAVKEASGDVGFAGELIAEVGDRLDVYSGNDNVTLPILALGGAGVISVASNIIPREMHDLCRLFFEGRMGEAAAISHRYSHLMRVLFSEVNPIPVKTAMALMGMCREQFRLPLCEMEEKNRALLCSALSEVNLRRV